MRLIDADELIEFLKKVTITDGITFETGFKQILTDIKNQPTFDAVAVLRCRDCARWGTGVAGETESVKCCEYAGYMIGENGYCLYGERKEHGEIH